ncbi:hypothetical protein KP509_26G030700 [Ceratopteris richardii]|uniref:MBD domain-containing protein n=1 Tax=Ceratopteris richardii TaxID=49495 RepID=A0A8T2RLQ4_CERRI|nr:hypothetical protein KP509_26G030700 [Ceratopteris richardii]
MDDTTIDALREVLQDMTAAIELISSGERSGIALIHFIEEMLKTIESWAMKYGVLLDDDSLALTPTQDRKVDDLRGRPDPPLRIKDSAEGEAAQEPVESLRKDFFPGTADEGHHFTHSLNSAELQLLPSRLDHGSSELPAFMAVQITPETHTECASTHDIVTFTDDEEGKMLFSNPGISMDQEDTGCESFESRGNMTESPNWLPDGWTVELKQRAGGASAGSKEKIYIDPTSHHHFRTKKEVLTFLNSDKRKRGRPKKNDLLKDTTLADAVNTLSSGTANESLSISNSEVQSPPNVSPSNTMSSQFTAAMSPDVANSTKRKRGRPRKLDSMRKVSQAVDRSVEHVNISGQVRDVSQPLVSSFTEPRTPSRSSSLSVSDVGLLGVVPSIPTSLGIPGSNTCVPLPPQSRQPSEWLVYENLANLPFPMFDQLRFVENNPNKSINSSPPNLWPWMLGSSQALKKPFADVKLNEGSLNEEKNQDEFASVSSVGIKVEEETPSKQRKQDEIIPLKSVEGAQTVEILAKRPKKVARKNAS